MSFIFDGQTLGTMAFQNTANANVASIAVNGVDIGTGLNYVFSTTNASFSKANSGINLYNVKYFGAIGDGNSHPVSTVLGVSTKAALAAYSVNGNTPYSFISTQLFQYVARLQLTAEVSSGNTVLPVLNATNVPQGANVAGLNIPAGAYVTSNQVTTTIATTCNGGCTSSAFIPLANVSGITIGSALNPINGAGYNSFVQSINAAGVIIVGQNSTIANNAAVQFFVPPTTITISAGVSNTLHKGKYIVANTALTDAQVANLEMDYIGTQAAIQACKTSSTGGSVYQPAGRYRHNWNLIIPETNETFGFVNPQSSGVNSVNLVGDGKWSTINFWPTDLGGGRCAISCGDPQATYDNGLGRYGNYYAGLLADMCFIGPNSANIGGSLYGIAPVAMNGIMWGARRHVRDVAVQFFYTGCNISGDHSMFDNCSFTPNYYGIYFDEAGNLYGDLTFTNVLSSSSMAGIAVHPCSAISAQFSGCYPCGSPYGIFKESGNTAPNYNNNIVSGCMFNHCNMEWYGNGLVYDQNGESTNNITGIVSPGTKNASMVESKFDSCYMSWGINGATVVSNIPSRPRRAVIDVYGIQGIQLLNQTTISALTPGTTSVFAAVSFSSVDNGLLIEGDMDTLCSTLNSTGLPICDPEVANVGQMFIKLRKPCLWEGTVFYANGLVASGNVVEHNGFGGVANAGTVLAAPCAGIAMHTANNNNVVVAQKHVQAGASCTNNMTYPLYVKKGISSNVAACTGSGGIPALGEVPIGVALWAFGTSATISLNAF